jgi:hypothetical protein
LDEFDNLASFCLKTALLDGPMNSGSRDSKFLARFCDGVKAFPT